MQRLYKILTIEQERKRRWGKWPLLGSVKQLCNEGIALDTCNNCNKGIIFDMHEYNHNMI
jgi:hypothetical protein